MLSRTVGDILHSYRNKLPAVDMYYLLSHAISKNREFMLAHPEYEMGFYSYTRCKRMLRRRIRGVPAAYLTGEKEFYGLAFHVNRHTLIPRPETELLVDEIIQRQPMSLLDLGTGSGCIAIAVAHHLPLCRITAVDISRRALSVAELNCRRLECTRISLIRSDYFRSLKADRYDIITSNPPYVVQGDVKRLSPEVAEHEPSVALYGGEDGLKAYRVILRNARKFLTPGGVLVLEISPEIASAFHCMAEEDAYRVVRLERDLAGHQRMIVLSAG
jgi:release factor glutamine methyltransferase